MSDTPPDPPAGVTVSAGSESLTFTWNAVATATGYNLYWGTTPGVTTSSGTKIADVSSPFTLNDLSPATTYYAIVTAVNADGESDPATEVSDTPAEALPAQVVGVSTTPGNASVSLSWLAASNATSYNVYWSTDPGVTTTSGTALIDVSSPLEVDSLTNGLTYYFIVTARNSSGEGPASDESSATPLATTTELTQVNIGNDIDFFGNDILGEDVAVNDTGIAYAVWVEQFTDDANTYINGNRYDTNWGTSETLSPAGAITPKVVVDANGDVTLCYVLRNWVGGTFIQSSAIWCRRQVNGSWGNPEEVSVDPMSNEYAISMNIAVDGQNNVMAAWSQQDEIMSSRFDYVSSVWSAPTQHTSAIRNVFEPTIGADASGNFIMAWFEDMQAYDSSKTAGGPRETTLFANRYSNGWAASPTQIGRPNPDDRGVERAKVAVNAVGAAVVVWEQIYQDTGTTVHQVDSVRYDPTLLAWADPVIVTTHDNYVSWPDVAMDDAGNTLVIWDQTTSDGSTSDALVSEYDTALNLWNTPETVNLTNPAYEAQDVRIGLDGAGNARVIWHQENQIQTRYKAVNSDDGWEGIEIAGRRGGDIAFAMSRGGYSLVVTTLIDLSPPGERSTWATVLD